MTNARRKPNFTLSVAALTGAAFVQVAWLPAAHAQERPYPYKVARFVTSLGVGSGADGMTRAVAEQLSRRLGQTFIVDSRPGAGGNIAAEAVAKAPPDGYTLFMSSLAANSINTSYYKKLNYDLRRDFVPITKFAHIANGLFTGPGLKANTVAELTALAKADPGKLTCASSGTGGLLHLTCEMYKKAAGIDVVHVPYKGSVIWMPELTVGSVTMVFDNIPIYVPLVKAGKLKALMITMPNRSPVLPDVPTAAEAGLKNMVSRGLFGLLAPAGTPQPIVQLLNRELVAILGDSALRERMLQQGIELESTSPEGLRDMIDQEINQWARVMKEANISGE
jgi:tripartite-type tricarboxylate transporter receptor subunit TctC